MLFNSLLDQFVSSFARANVLSIFEFDALIHRLFIKEFDQQTPKMKDIRCVFNLQESKIMIYVGVDGDICVNLEF